MQTPAKLSCEFEEWDREKHAMGHCREVATMEYLGKNLCEFHFTYASEMSGTGVRFAVRRKARRKPCK